jgi:hypothetical protein
MVQVVEAVVTDDARLLWPQLHGGITLGAPLTFQVIDYFKVGEGGYQSVGASLEPRTPDPSLRRLAPDPLLQDIDIIVDTNRAAADKRYTPPGGLGFEVGTLTVADKSIQTPSTLRCLCSLAAGTGVGRNFWEIGLFSTHPDTTTYPGEKLMVAYGTFPLVVKGGTAMDFLVLVTWG